MASSFGEKGAILFADCAVVPDPTPPELAEIALATAENARAFLESRAARRVSFLLDEGLRFARSRQKILEALRIAKARQPDLLSMANYRPTPRSSLHRSSKAPGSPVAGRANV